MVDDVEALHAIRSEVAAKPLHVWVIAFGISHGAVMTLALHDGHHRPQRRLLLHGAVSFRGDLRGGPYRLQQVTRDDGLHVLRATDSAFEVTFARAAWSTAFEAVGLERWLATLRGALDRPLTISEQHLLEEADDRSLIVRHGSQLPASQVASTYRVRRDSERFRRADGKPLWDGLEEVAACLAVLGDAPVRMVSIESSHRLYLLIASGDGELLAVASMV